MRKNYFYIILLFLALGFTAQKAEAARMVEIIEVEQQLHIYVTGTVLHIVGGNGQMMELYNVAGVKIKSVTIEGNERHFNINLTRGCYIVKVGKTTRKISIS